MDSVEGQSSDLVIRLGGLEGLPGRLESGLGQAGDGPRIGRARIGPTRGLLSFLTSVVGLAGATGWGTAIGAGAWGFSAGAWYAETPAPVATMPAATRPAAAIFSLRRDIDFRAPS